MISIAVIDDEARARDTLINILALSPLELKVIGEASSIKDGRKLLHAKNPDIVLLDVNLLDGTGFDLLKQIPLPHYKVIFITAHEEYAIRAFRFSAVDYILKPVVAGELLAAIDKAAQTISREETELKLNALLSNLDSAKKIVLKTAESIHIVQISNIIRCEADINYTTFFLKNTPSLLVSKTLKDFADLLEPTGSYRTHKSHLVNINHIVRFDKGEGGHLVMDDESIVPVSSRKREKLFSLFEKM